MKNKQIKGLFLCAQYEQRAFQKTLLDLINALSFLLHMLFLQPTIKALQLVAWCQRSQPSYSRMKPQNHIQALWLCRARSKYMPHMLNDGLGWRSWSALISKKISATDDLAKKSQWVNECLDKDGIHVVGLVLMS